MEERRCLRCGAPYDEGATVCFTCGASIGELETPTQPVRAPRRAVASVTSDGAVQAETETASTASSAAGSAALATGATTTDTPARPLTVGGSSYQSGAATTTRTRRKVRWPLVAGLLVVLIALAAGAVVEVRALLAPPPVPATTTYHDPQRRFSFTEPSLWTVTPQANGALLTDSTGASTLTLTVASAPQGQTASDIADALAVRQSLQSAPNAVIGGDTWEQRSGSVTGSDGATRIVTVYVDIHDSKVYTIQTSSPTSVASSINTLVYQPLLASFAFR